MSVVRTVAEHARVVADLITEPEPRSLMLADAAGHVLAADVSAARGLPPFDNSAMDGYAVRAADIAGATAEAPVWLLVAQDIPAGRGDAPALAPGTAHRIMTGAAMPDGADGVVQVELTNGGVDVVRVDGPSEPGRFVRRAGEDVQPGEVVLRAGAVLGAAQLGLLAALGEPTVSVVPPLRVVVLSTGSELVEPGQPLRHGQIHESNGIMLATAVRAAGAYAEQVHFVPDDVDAFRSAFDKFRDFDLVLTSGGVSAGAFEVVKDALVDEDVEFVKVAMQPGMPQGAGRFRGIPIITLPGNPVSSLVSFEVFVRPALRAAMGYADVHRPVVSARLAEALESPRPPAVPARTARSRHGRGRGRRATWIALPAVAGQRRLPARRARGRHARRRRQ